MAVKFIPRDRFSEVIAGIAKGREIFGHQIEAGQPGQTGRPHMVRTGADDLVLGTARAVEPLKALLFPPRDDLGECFDAGKPDAPLTAIVGATACDLRALKVLDQVFLGGEFKDPYYEKKRKNLLVVSMDCTLPFDVCFCMFFGDAPNPSEGYDLNLTPLAGGKDGYLVESGSEQGEKLLAEAGLTDASAALLERRTAQRKEAAEQVKRQAAAAGLSAVETITERFRASRDAAFWKKHADKCVECGACNFICPACHCFLLVDVEARGRFKRFKNWDSCLYPAFARVAGGANPRPRRIERLRNRFEKKFDFLQETIKLWGCTGCGRCTEACAGDIDVREVLRDILSPSTEGSGS